MVSSRFVSRRKRGIVIVFISGLFLWAAAMACQTNMTLFARKAPSPTPSRTPVPPSPTPKPTRTPQPTHTPTTTPTPMMNGFVFHDLNGDGLPGEDEPGIPQAEVCLNLSSGQVCAVSGEQGDITLPALPPGEYGALIQVEVEQPYLAFRYANRFFDWLEVQAYTIAGRYVPKQRLPQTSLENLENEVTITVSEGQPVSIGLTQGYLTDVFPCGVRQRIAAYQGFDLDERPGFVRHYNEPEARVGKDDTTQTVFSGDNHFAYDWGDSNRHIIGTPILAAANGVVVFAGKAQTWNGSCQLVQLAHPEAGAISGYVHLDTVLVRDMQKVLRGQVIGTLGMNCTTWPHLHFYFRPSSYASFNDWEGSDPYRDLFDPQSRTAWTADNEPQCPSFVEPIQLP